MTTIPPAVHVRHATLADVPALAPLFDAYRQFYEQPTDLALAERFLTERLERGEAMVLIAETGEGAARQAVGFCQCYPCFCSILARPIFVLYDLFVAPSARGLGAARALMLRAEDEARLQGKARLDLTTAHTNLPAQKLYESLGWELDTVYRAYTRTV